MRFRDGAGSLLAAIYREAFEQVLGKPWQSLQMNLLYDVCHNIAKLEEHTVAFRALIHEAHERGSSVEPAEAARHSFETVFRIAEQNADLVRILARERESDDARVRDYLRESRRRWLEALVEDYRRLGLEAAAGDRLHLAAGIISAMTEGAVLHFLDLPARERTAQRGRILDALVRFTLGGLVGLLGAPPPAPRRRTAKSTGGR